MNIVAGADASGINRLLKDTLRFEADAPHVVHAPIRDKWSWKDFANEYANTKASLPPAVAGANGAGTARVREGRLTARAAQRFGAAVRMPSQGSRRGCGGVISVTS